MSVLRRDGEERGRRDHEGKDGRLTELGVIGSLGRIHHHLESLPPDDSIHEDVELKEESQRETISTHERRRDTNSVASFRIKDSPHRDIEQGIRQHPRTRGEERLY